MPLIPTLKQYFRHHALTCLSGTEFMRVLSIASRSNRHSSGRRRNSEAIKRVELRGQGSDVGKVGETGVSNTCTDGYGGEAGGQLGEHSWIRKSLDGAVVVGANWFIIKVALFFNA